MKYLRSIRFWVFTVVLVAAAAYSWNWYEWDRYCRPRTAVNYSCPGYKVISVQKLGENNELTNGFDTVYYACNEIILQPGGMGPYAEELRRYLRCQGFVPADKCACTDSIELWRHGLPDVDLIGVITDPPSPKTSGSGGLSLNYEIEHEPLALDSPAAPPDSGIVSQTSLGNNSPLQVIGITDSGVDLMPGSPLMANGYLFTPDPNRSCGIVSGKYGQNMLQPTLEPWDDVGHGTFIGGILAGGANSVPKKAIPVRLFLLNIKITEHNSGYLFDAVCGLFYGLEQGVKVFNVSWGYLDTVSNGMRPKYMSAFLNDPRAQDAIIVAALGNNGVLLDGNNCFWPACMAEYSDNVISVGASDNTGQLAKSKKFSTNFSTTRKRMTLLAPGVDIVSLVPEWLQMQHLGTHIKPTGYSQGSGTSFAAPFVTREAAVALTVMSANAVKAYIINKQPLVKQTLISASCPFLTI